ncbi:PAS domain-containing protein [Nannocystis pusilla]|uniref:PAS domain-containing protein n=1 Tax=Nannocystis pusilla TaxID=889268 RepID=UPI003B7B6DAF
MPGATPPHQQNLLEFTHEAVIALDEAERVTFWNRAAERMYGWTAAEALGRTLPELLRADCLRDVPTRCGRTGLPRGPTSSCRPGRTAPRCGSPPA